MSKKANENKLMKNLNNIVKNYLKVNDGLLEQIAKEDQEGIKEQLINNSTDNFLRNILDEYPIFTSELIHRIEIDHQSTIQKLKEKGKEQIVKAMPKKTKTTLTLKNPGKLKAKKGTRHKWTKTEERRLKTLKESGKTNKEITDKLNASRLKKGLVLRTQSSVKNKWSRIKE